MFHVLPCLWDQIIQKRSFEVGVAVVCPAPLAGAVDGHIVQLGAHAAVAGVADDVDGGQLLDDELPQQAITSAFRKYKR